MLNITHYQRNANQNYNEEVSLHMGWNGYRQKKSINSNCWRGCGKKGLLLYCWWECTLIQPLQKMVWRFLFLGDSLSPCLLYNVTNLHPQFIRQSVYQIQSLKSIFQFHCIVIRDLSQVIPAWSSGFPHFLQFQSEFGNKEFMI